MSLGVIRFRRVLVARKYFEKVMKRNILINEPKMTTSSVLDTNDPKSVQIAAKLLKTSQVIALPTDTVYGLACNANDSSAIQKIYRIKGRDDRKPVAICVSDIKSLKHYGTANHLPDELLHRLLPGPVTLVLQKSHFLNNPNLNHGISKIGIRIPNCKFIQEVSKACEFPVALTSANRSSEKSTLNVLEFKGLWPLLGGIFDGGPLGLTEEQRAASTVIDLASPGEFKIIREGIAGNQSVAVLQEFGLKKCR